MKDSLTDNELQVWESMRGTELSTYQQQNVVRDLLGDFDLSPVVMRLGSKVVPFNKSQFHNEVTLNDYHCMAYYNVQDCEKVFGSSRRNWRDWARCALALQGKGEQDVRDYWTIPWREVYSTKPEEWPTKFLSARMVVFYLAAQTRTWDASPTFHRKATKAKDMLRKNQVSVIPILPLGEDLNLDEIAPPRPAKVVTLPQEEPITPEPEPTPAPLRYPHTSDSAILNYLLNKEEGEFQALLEGIYQTRNTQSHRLEFKKALRDALRGETIYLDTIIHNEGVQNWMCTLAASIAMKKPEYAVTSWERLLYRQVLVLLSGLVEGEEARQATQTLVGMLAAGESRYPLRRGEFLAAIN